MPSAGNAIGGIIGTGVSMFGANKAREHLTEGAANQRNTLQAALAYQQGLREAAEKRSQPYEQLGVQGAQGLGKFDLMEGVGPQVSYDKEYTNRLKDYEESPAFLAQNSLAQADLERQRQARGLSYGGPAASANAKAELGQKLRATDFDKYRGDLAQRYSALTGEYNQRRDINKDKYQRLMDMTKIGWGATSSLNDLGRGYAGLASNTMNGMADTWMTQAKANAGFYGNMMDTAMSGAKAGSGLGGMIGGGGADQSKSWFSQ